MGDVKVILSAEVAFTACLRNVNIILTSFGGLVRARICLKARAAKSVVNAGVVFTALILFLRSNRAGTCLSVQ